MSSRSSKSVSSKTSKSTNNLTSSRMDLIVTGFLARERIGFVMIQRSSECTVFFIKSTIKCDTGNSIPCKRLRKESLIFHEESQAHRDSVKLERIASRTNVSSAIAPTLPEKGIQQAFCCFYFRIPHTTNFEPLLKLTEVLGSSIQSTPPPPPPPLATPLSASALPTTSTSVFHPMLTLLRSSISLA